MNEFVTFLIALFAVGLGFFVIGRKPKKKKEPPRRVPQRVNPPPLNTGGRAPVARLPAPTASTATRKPRPVVDREYMNYRNCPDCHSENEVNRQVIFKLAPHQFVCKVCGKHFNF